MKRYFAFLFVEDEYLSNILNVAIAALNPRERWPAHVTLAGPFSSLRSVPRKLEFQRRLSVLSVSQFRSDTQNTVHFVVGAEGMRNVWKKADYPYNPHLTIYDGTNHDLGDELYFRLRQLRPIFKFDVTRMHIVESGAQRDFNLLSGLDLGGTIPALRGLQEQELDSLSDDERIEVAVAAVNAAVQYSSTRR